MSEELDFYRGLVDNLYDGVYFVDRERKITYWNKGAERITGYSREQVIGISCSDDVLNHVTADGRELCREGCPLAACILDGQVREMEAYLQHADGHRIPVLVRAAPLIDAGGNILGAVETFSSDAGLLAVRSELHDLRRKVQMDPLTGLGNRVLLERRLRGAIAEMGQDTRAALLFIDVDEFKRVNDTYGHEVGDKVLSMVAATLRYNLRDEDVIGRWGGDELMAILHDLSSLQEAEAVAEKLRVLVSFSGVDGLGVSLPLSISVGVTLLQPGDTPESVVRRADALMYQGKQAGGNRVTAG